MPRTYTEVEFKEAVAHQVETEVQKAVFNVVVDIWEAAFNAVRAHTPTEEIAGMMKVYFAVANLNNIDAKKLHTRLSEEMTRDE